MLRQAMPEENVQVVPRGFEAFMRRDNETALAFYDPDFAVRGVIDPDVRV
jgi:ketosteroid isomerase-like protein